MEFSLKHSSIVHSIFIKCPAYFYIMLCHTSYENNRIKQSNSIEWYQYFLYVYINILLSKLSDCLFKNYGAFTFKISNIKRVIPSDSIN